LKARLGGAASGAGTVDFDQRTYDVAYARAEQWTLFVIARR